MSAQPRVVPQRSERVKRPMTTAQLRAHLQRTLAKALAMGVSDQVERIDFGLYRVPSTTRSGLVHTVMGTTSSLECTCEAFGHMPLCVHRAAVLIKRWRSEGKTVVVNDAGDVVVREEVDAAALAFPAGVWDTPAPELKVLDLDA